MRKTKQPAVPPAPEISPAEWRVMELIWEEAPQSAAGVQERLAATCGWALGTVNTLLRRLTEKGALRIEKRGREFFYHPLAAREDCALRESRSLVDRVFGGRLAPLVAAFVERQPLTDAELAELQAVLERARSRKS